MKKLMALVLSLFLLCGMVTAGWAETGEEASAGEQVTYTYQLKADGTAELTGVSDEQLNHMDIPAEVEGHKVTSIGVFAFGNCSSVLSVSIPEGVKTVEPHAFANSFELKSVSIPDSLESIGNSAFRSKRLTEIILSPDHPVYAVENEALIDKRDMSLVQFLAPENTGTYVVEPGITKIREDAFQFARVSAILIPDSVTSIGAMAFTNCENLKSINIPDSVTEMGNDVFSGCDSLTSIQISPYHPKFECVDLVMVKKDTKEMFAASGALQGKYVIPGDIRSIADGAFQWCMYLEEIYIPETVQEIGEYAFSNNYVILVCEGSAAERYCEQAADRVRHTVMSLEEFTEAVAQLEKEPAFSVQEITPSSWRNDRGSEVSGDYRYNVRSDGTAEITSVDEFVEVVYIPTELDGHKVTSIASGAFDSCSNLVKVVIPEGVTFLDYGSFEFCWQLESITIPDSLIHIGRQPFIYCPNLKNVVISPTHPVLKIDDGMLIDQSTMTLFYQLDRKQTRDITVPQGIRAIAENAFNSSACSSIILPDSLTEIGSNAFGSCPNLKELVIPEGVKTIGGQAVYGCENLESITIPSTVEYIDGGLFGANKALTKVIISPDNPNYEMIDHLLVDKRDMKIVMALNSTPAKYEIPEGIKKIGFMAFQGSDDLEELVVPEGFTEIGTSAFSGCSKLCKITLPASVNEIETYVFEYSYHLVIKAPEGSYAQEFCKKNGYEFIPNS